MLSDRHVNALIAATRTAPPELRPELGAVARALAAGLAQQRVDRVAERLRAPDLDRYDQAREVVLTTAPGSALAQLAAAGITAARAAGSPAVDAVEQGVLDLLALWELDRSITLTASEAALLDGVFVDGLRYLQATAPQYFDAGAALVGALRAKLGRVFAVVPDPGADADPTAQADGAGGAA